MKVYMNGERLYKTLDYNIIDNEVVVRDYIYNKLDKSKEIDFIKDSGEVVYKKNNIYYCY